MEIQEISFREWVVCKVRSLSVPSVVPVPMHEHFRRTTIRRATIMVRLVGDRRGEEGGSFVSKERRRVPERRIPEPGEASFDEFERWKKYQDSR